MSREQADFSDLEGHWAKDTVEQLADEGVISGFEDGTFRPDQSVTRAEFTKMIVQAFFPCLPGARTFPSPMLRQTHGMRSPFPSRRAARSF